MGQIGATCNSEFGIEYVSGPNFGVVGDVYRVKLSLGAGDVGGIGNLVTINNVRFNLDCDVATGLGIDCTDDGLLVAYSGNLADTCAAVNFSTRHALDGVVNQVVFVPNIPLDIPENTANFCSLKFDVTILALDTDNSVNLIEESGGYRDDGVDATCNNTLSGGNSAAGAIFTCPACDNGLFCDGTETCNQETGMCVDGADPVCGDGLFCNGNEVCDEETDACSNPPDVVCTDGLFCNGVEECDEGTDSCTNPPDVVCNDDATCTTDSLRRGRRRLRLHPQ